MSSTDDLLEKIEYAPPVRNIAELVQSARAAFQLLEPWCLAKNPSEHWLVRKTINQVQEQAFSYFQAIDMSIRHGEAGSRFAEDATALFKFIYEEEPAKDVLDYIHLMKDIAKKAHRDAKRTVDLFVSVKKGVIKITRDVPQGIIKIKKEIVADEVSKRRHNAVAEICEHIVKKCKDSQKLTTIVDNILCGVPIIPHLAIILPVVIPIAVFVTGKVAGMVETKCQHRVAEANRKQEEQTYQVAISQLKNVETDMNNLIQYVETFVKWWSDITTTLDKIKSNVSKSSIPVLPNFPLVRDQWTVIKHQYDTYASEIRKLQDFYPASYRKEDP